MRVFNLLLIVLTLAQGHATEAPVPRVLFELPASPLAITNSDPRGNAVKSFVLPIDSIRGAYVFVSAKIKAVNVSAKTQPHNGIKLMLKIETPNRTDWRNPISRRGPSIGSGSLTAFSFRKTRPLLPSQSASKKFPAPPGSMTSRFRWIAFFDAPQQPQRNNQFSAAMTCLDCGALWSVRK